MSNIKQVSIKGQMPFNIYENDEAVKLLGILNSPSIGIKIEYGAHFSMPSKHNTGVTTYYNFTIGGQEAVQWKTLKHWVSILEDAGCVLSTMEAKDIENIDGRWEVI